MRLIMNEKIFLILFISFVFIIFISIAYVDIAGDVPYGRSCSDSDNGIFPNQPGGIVSDIGSFYDRCYDNLREIREYFCTKGRYGGIYKVDSKVVRCDVGFQCERDVQGKMDS